MIKNLKSCPFCGSINIIDCYVYMKCEKCGAKGPCVNNGINDDHVDHYDNLLAISLWNNRK